MHLLRNENKKLPSPHGRNKKQFDFVLFFKIIVDFFLLVDEQFSNKHNPFGLVPCCTYIKHNRAERKNTFFDLCEIGFMEYK
jgi:hypothetical protein